MLLTSLRPGTLRARDRQRPGRRALSAPCRPDREPGTGREEPRERSRDPGAGRGELGSRSRYPPEPSVVLPLSLVMTALPHPGNNCVPRLGNVSVEQQQAPGGKQGSGGFCWFLICPFFLSRFFPSYRAGRGECCRAFTQKVIFWLKRHSCSQEIVLRHPSHLLVLCPGCPQHKYPHDP